MPQTHNPHSTRHSTRSTRGQGAGRPTGPTRELRFRFGENIRLKSPVQGYFYLQQYAEGIRRFEGIYNPSPDDERWGSVCYDAQGQPSIARFLIDQAISKHNLGAQLELARHLLRQGENTAALKQLHTLELSSLDPIDRMLWHGARSELLFRLESVDSALPDAEKALLEVQNLPEISVCSLWVYGQLGKLYGAQGDDHSAVYYLNRALEGTLTGNPGLELERAYSFIHLGRFGEAQNELTQLNQAAENASSPTGQSPFSSHSALLELAWGRFYQAQNNPTQAVRHFQEALSRAQAAGKTADKATLEAALALSTLLEQTGGQQDAAAQLETARDCLSSPLERLLFELRETVVLRRQNLLTPGIAAQKLLEISSSFARLGRVRETCWALLHAADSLLEDSENPAREDAAQAALETLSTQVQGVYNPALLWGERPALSAALVSLLERRFPALMVSEPSSVIDLITLGQERIAVGGKLVPVPMRRFVEVLTYIHINGEVTLAQVVQDIFTDEPLQKTRNYFHQLRHQLKLYTAQLEVMYSPQSRTYRLETRLPLRWDVDTVRSGRDKLNGREFLPGSGSEWVMRLGAELSGLEG